MPRVAREKEMSVSSEALRSAILDFANYPEFITEVVSAKRAESKDANRFQVTFELEVIKRFEYILEFDLSKENQIRWRLVKSNFFKKNDGSWTIETKSSGIHVKYELDVDFGFLVPGWVSKKLTEINLPKMLDNFEARAKKMQGK